MKHLRKIVFVMVAIAMVLAIGTTAFAAGQGSITVNNATVGKDYELYKIFDLTKGRSAVAYTVDSDWENFFFNGGAGSAYLPTAQPEGGSLSQMVYNGTVYYMNITDTNVSDFANAAQAYAESLSPDASKTATGTSVSFTGLDLGYYLVLPVDATEIASGNGSICSLTNADPDGTINAKGQYPTVDKVVDDQDVEVGQQVTWTVTSKVPDTTGYSTFIYKLTDTMSAGLTFGNSIATTNFVVKFGNAVIIDDTHAVSASDDLDFSNNGFVLTMDMAKYQTYKGQTITVTYTAVVNENAVCEYTHNRVKLDYGHNPNDLEQGTPVEVPVWSSKIIIDKFDANDQNTKLADAKFVMYKLVNGVKYYYKYTAAAGTTPAKVEWLAEGENGAIPAGATEVVTSESGEAVFSGLESGEYYLHETESPAGYNLLTTDATVTVTAPTQNGTGNSVGVSVTKEVANSSGNTLPETGGIGTTIFYVLGAILLIGAGVILFVRKRVGTEQ